MTLLLIPLSLIVILLLTGLLCTLPSITAPTLYDPYTRQPLSPVAGFYLAEWLAVTSEIERIVDTRHITIQRPRHTPIRLQLRWKSNRRSSSMSVMQEAKSKLEGITKPIPTARAMKRFSVQLPLVQSEPREHIKSPSLDSHQSTSPKIIEAIEPVNFLEALAAQERRVLELKEELQKAETDLTKLKRQWAHHEAMRKRQEIKQQAQPMTSMKSPNSDVTVAQEMQQASHLARRRTLITKARPTQRKVFEGGRHTRALSLLSPTSLVNRGSVADDMTSNIKNTIIEQGPVTATPRVTTPVQNKAKPHDPSKEDIVTTSKQIMGDIKEGLWTFIEDLRQATVGDEALSASRSKQIETGNVQAQMRNTVPVVGDLITLGPAPAPRKKSPARPDRNDTGKIASAEPALTQENPETAPTSVTNDLSDDDGEAWDNWDSPPSKSSASNFSSTARSTPRSSLSSDVKRQSATFDQISWPALQKLSPGNLTRTASNLMNQWEQSLKQEANESSTSH